MSNAIGDRKRDLRRWMRQLRSSVDDQAERSIMLWSHVRDEPAVRAARTLMAYASVQGEPESAGFIDWCLGLGKHVVVPESDPAAPLPADPRSLDVVIVPGLAFTSRGDRLGQGGGWYDRFLAEVRDDCTTIGVCFAIQLVDDLPIEPHDTVVDIVITEDGRAEPPSADGVGP